MNWYLIRSLAAREIKSRYQGSFFGAVWLLLTPLLLLAVYTFVFKFVFAARWPSIEGESTADFALVLFAGLLVFQFFSEIVTRAPTLILNNQSLVTKVVFPVSILVPVALTTALFQALINIAVLLVFYTISQGSFPLNALWLPVVLAPLCALVLGLGWALASIGVYFRDINQILTPIMTALLFLAPIFFPSSALPQVIRPFIQLNPLTIPVEQTRRILVENLPPDPMSLVSYSVVAALVLWLGWAWFKATQRGFADVL